MNTILYVFHDAELYEVHLRGAIVARILRFVHDNSAGREIEWDDLDEEVQRKIVTEFKKSR